VVERANVVVSGAGSTSVHVRQSLDAEISGAGNVTYAGTPKVLKTISGAGSLRPKLAG
jgi:Putative auto-transporter adhesin, head GIN domain